MNMNLKCSFRKDEIAFEVSRQNWRTLPVQFYEKSAKIRDFYFTNLISLNGSIQ